MYNLIFLFRSKRYCPLLESLQLKYNCFEKEIDFFLYVYKFRSVKVIELIFTTASKFIVISFNLNRKWLKGRDTNGKTVQLVNIKYVCIVTWQEERREPVWSCFSTFFFLTHFDNYWEITSSKCVLLEVTNIFIDTITNPFAIANFTTNFTSTFYQLLQLKIRWPRFSVKLEYHQRPGFYLLA